MLCSSQLQPPPQVDDDVCYASADDFRPPPSKTLLKVVEGQAFMADGSARRGHSPAALVDSPAASPSIPLSSTLPPPSPLPQACSHHPSP